MQRRFFLKVAIYSLLGLQYIQAKNSMRLEELHNNPWSLKDNKHLQNNKVAVMSAVSQNGYVLMYASKKLKDDTEVVRTAIQRDPRSIRYASKRLQKYFGNIKK